MLIGSKLAFQANGVTFFNLARKKQLSSVLDNRMLEILHFKNHGNSENDEVGQSLWFEAVKDCNGIGYIVNTLLIALITKLYNAYIF